MILRAKLTLKPSPEQEQRMRQWLADRVWAIQTADFAPVQSKAIRRDIEDGVDFSELCMEYGFRPNGGLSVSFYEVNKHRVRPPSAKEPFHFKS